MALMHIQWGGGGKKVVRKCTQPILASLVGTPLVVVSEGGQNLGCSRLLFGFFFFHLTPALALTHH